jgi:hypothetical protein
VFVGYVTSDTDCSFGFGIENVLRTLLVIPEEVLEYLGSLEGTLVSYSPSSFDGFGHLSGFG